MSRCWHQVQERRKHLADDGGKRAVLRGEHDISRKAIAQGRPGCSVCTCMLVCMFCLRKSHTGSRVQRAPGLPCALISSRGQHEDANLGQTCRENAKLYPRHCERSEAIHRSDCRAMDCFAALAMTRIGRGVSDPPVRFYNLYLYKRFRIQCVPCRNASKSRTIDCSKNASIQTANGRATVFDFFGRAFGSKRG